ncbi:MAG TPA: hypothetical protein VFR94_24805 [Nitrososphaeraceae archaeon]|nr:hypothetical protein [Nitrososphaeraceae archaeon]
MANKRGRLEEGKIDMNSEFYSIFHEWCIDYFNHMWQLAKPFNPNKLNEV